ncbi:uncharacterized protein LOC118740527 isoform X5 [Rhagoletis pomonella]|uniref:uncharacterized protein LOC118740527 isoform X5 n=1 Tax=Rhagoletis pomonella TaxID=28610 RepID=UPI001782F540|nr:uncharacterized protein LOC118740527 isoform X5 [Rhagoletis pomonella]
MEWMVVDSVAMRWWIILMTSKCLAAMKLIKITNRRQMDRLVALMEQNREIARGKLPCGSSRQDVKETWEQFAVELNNLGPPTRTAPEWQRVWIHCKAKLKRKLSIGGGPSQVNLTATEERVHELTRVNPFESAFSLDVANDAYEDTSTNSVVESPIIKITNKQQFDLLVALMEQNLDIARGKRPYGSSRQDVKETWEQFAVELNNLGPPTRTGPEWQRVWIHHKAKLKRKLATGGGPSQEVRRVYELTHVDPFESVFGFEVANGTHESNSVNSDIESPVVEVATPTPKQESPDMGEAKLILLEKQAETQNEILQTLKQIENIKYKEYLLKKQKLEVIEQSEKRKSVLRELKIKIAQAKLKKLEE